MDIFIDNPECYKDSSEFIRIHQKCYIDVSTTNQALMYIKINNHLGDFNYKPNITPGASNCVNYRKSSVKTRGLIYFSQS